ncbi:putative potassium channel, voltage-dependent, EAG [Rosa chinensis]|uniref:Putative potassium channel, voltage-dependent, EAG n=1 Tax=Rosa chinensis TaxID=74649 RepID=A0A2P6SGR6_ROSCH|nr:putative potassium channel, voltage-dependent, EAG [Rosa chinensis]
MSQSFWWALRNLSSFGSNLQTSLYTVEIFLSVMISISGMVLFLVYLNARVQESQELLDQSKSKKKQSQELLDQSESKKKQSLKLWLDKNEIRPNTDQMETIMNNIHKLEENKDIDVQNMLSILPVDDKKSIIQLLCLASLKKVPVFENIDQNILIAICDHLKPVTYTEDSYIVQEGRPLGKMLFIVEGLAWTYTTSNIIDVGTLKRGDYYGEEVLTWAFQPPSFSGLPISTRTVMSQEKIEAFAIRAGDLKSVVCKFRCHFRKKVDFSQLQLWENGASVMQSLKSQVIDITPCP